MAEYFYRESGNGSRGMSGPFNSEEEARRAARYKGMRVVEVLKKVGPNYEPIDTPVAAPKDIRKTA
jgi:hypothetical protein